MIYNTAYKSEQSIVWIFTDYTVTFYEVCIGIDCLSVSFVCGMNDIFLVYHE